MIIVLEVSRASRPRVWSAFSKEEFCSAVEALADRGARTSYEALTGRELLERYDASSFEELKQWFPDQFGPLPELNPDQTYYWSHQDSQYQAEYIDRYEACVSYLARDLHSLKVFDNEADAIVALGDDTLWTGHKGSEAREVLADHLGPQLEAYQDKFFETFYYELWDLETDDFSSENPDMWGCPWDWDVGFKYTADPVRHAHKHYAECRDEILRAAKADEENLTYLKEDDF